MFSALRQWARDVKRDVLAVWLAMRDPRTPWFAKALGTVIVAYALSPIDLIPDFVPVLGYLDDLILLPAGLWIVIRLVPPTIMEDCRLRATSLAARPVSKTAAVVIVAIWVAAAAFGGWLLIEAP